MDTLVNYTCQSFIKAIKHSVNTIRYVTLPFRDRRGAASQRHINRAATTVLICELKPYPV